MTNACIVPRRLKSTVPLDDPPKIVLAIVMLPRAAASPMNTLPLPPPFSVPKMAPDPPDFCCDEQAVEVEVCCGVPEVERAGVRRDGVGVLVGDLKDGPLRRRADRDRSRR